MTSSESWDLIVVGAGSAGAAVAARCAERGQRVLLLEAGPDYRSADLPEVLRSPGHAPELHLDDWAHLVWSDVVATRTDVQEARLYMRGRGLGGSSTINGMIAIRPTRDDFDDYAAAGCNGWAWEDVLPYFCRIETDADFGHEPYHGDRGPIPVCRTPRADWGAVDEALAKASLAYGFRWAEDVNAPGATGVSPYPFNARDLRRVSTSDGYLEPARELENFYIRGDALVERVVVEAGRAAGVEIVEDGRRSVVRAEEIVLSAGAIHSPAILIRSGIGPAAALAELGIEVVADLPVGEGLQDHAMVIVGLPLRPGAGPKGPNHRFANGCVRFDSGDADGLPNDLMFVSLNYFDASGTVWPFRRLPGIDDPETSAGAGAISVWLNSSYARGSVEIVSSDPYVQPVVHERMLSDERDLRRLRHGARILAALASSEAVTEICNLSPQQANADLWAALDDDRALDEYLLATIVDSMHATSTCRMGAADSPTTVVDNDCRVLGVEGLRVADASIFPTCPRANTNLASIVVGEVVADRLTSVASGSLVSGRWG